MHVGPHALLGGGGVCIEPAVNDLLHHVLCQVLAHGVHDTPEEVSLRVLAFEHTTCVEEHHEFLVMGKLLEDELHCKLRLCWDLELWYLVTVYHVLLPNKDILQEAHPACPNSGEEDVHY